LLRCKSKLKFKRFEKKKTEINTKNTIKLDDNTKKIIDNLGFSDRCRAYKNDVVRAVEILGRKKEKFDIIFMDPPYQDNITTKVLKAIDKADILADDGLIICEHHLFEDLEDNIASFRKTDERI